MSSIQTFKFTLIFHLIALSSSAYAGVTIMENFEDLTAGAHMAPSNWTVHGGQYDYTTNGGCNSSGNNLGLGGTISTSTASSTDHPSSYLFSDTSFSSKDNISGSYNLYTQDSNLNDFTFSFGNISNGIGDSTGGNSMTVHVFSDTNNQVDPQFHLVDSNNTILSSGTLTGSATNYTWRKMDFVWVANGNGSGTFEISLSDYAGTTNFSTSINYTFTNEDIQLGFGTTATNSTSQFDNINVSSTAVPEPSSATLLGFFAFCLILRRSRRNSA